MSQYQPRISRDFAGFNADITTTNVYMMLPCPPPLGYLNWQRLGWTADEMAKWQDIETRWTSRYTLYNNKTATRTTDVKNQLKQIIKECVTLDRTHHLYDGIAINKNANNTDFETFHIIRGTPLAVTTYAHAPEPGTKEVVIVLKKMGNLFHQLLVTALGKEGRAKEYGVKEILVYKAVTGPKEPAPAVGSFIYEGSVSRGLIVINHKDAEIGQKAWYIARIKNSRGKMGVPSAIVGYVVV